MYLAEQAGNSKFYTCDKFHNTVLCNSLYKFYVFNASQYCISKKIAKAWDILRCISLIYQTNVHTSSQ